jgi:hypothetical protein
MKKKILLLLWFIISGNNLTKFEGTKGSYKILLLTTFLFGRQIYRKTFTWTITDSLLVNHTTGTWIIVLLIHACIDSPKMIKGIRLNFGYLFTDHHPTPPNAKKARSINKQTNAKTRPPRMSFRDSANEMVQQIEIAAN